MSVERSRGYYRPELETMDPEARQAYLDRRVAEIVAHAYEHSPAFRRRMDEAGAAPGDITSVEALRKLPPINKAQLLEIQRSDPPFGGLLATTPERLRRVYVSPGPIYEPGEEVYDDDRWVQAFYAAGFRPGDVAQVTFNFNMVPFAFWLDESLRKMGCQCIPAGVGNTELQVQIMKELGVTAYLGTPSFLAAIRDKARAMGLDPRTDLKLEVGFVAAEMLPESLRAELEEDFGMTIRQAYGTADVGCLSYECYHLGGMHFAQDCLVEIIDPVTGEPKGPGEPGEVVGTSFSKVYPIIRYATGDLSAYTDEPCECGRTSPKLTRIMGRVDAFTKIKGMFVHPSGVEQVAAKFPQIEAFQLVVERSGHQDVMRLECELVADASPSEELARAIAEVMKEILRLSGEVRFVPRGSLGPQPKVIDDRRKWD